MFRLLSKVYGRAVIPWKKLNLEKKINFFFVNFDICYKNHPPTRYIKYKVINFAPSNNSIMPNKLPLINLQRFLSSMTD